MLKAIVAIIDIVYISWFFYIYIVDLETVLTCLAGIAIINFFISIAVMANRKRRIAKKLILIRKCLILDGISEK